MDNTGKEAPGNVVDAETALAEVNRFLDLKRVSEAKREESFKANIKNLINSVEAGFLRFDFEKKRVIATLTVPLIRKKGPKITALELRFNIGVKQVLNNSRGKELEGGNEHSIYMIAALCDIPETILENAENEEGEQGLAIADFNALRDYALLFLA